MSDILNIANLGIRGKLIAGFAAVCLILAAAVGTTLFEVSIIQKTSSRIVELRMPTAGASQAMVNNINASLAALRGYMLTGGKAFKVQRHAVWADIDKVTADMDGFSKHWTVPANVEKWANFKEIMAEFRIAQQKVEDVSFTIDEQPATKVLVTEAAPRAGAMIGAITKMINSEAQEAATDERKHLFLQMANFRGSLGLGLANIRAYLLTGDEKFANNFTNFWKGNDKAFKNLSGLTSMFNATQSASFKKIKAVRAEFAKLPPKMFKIRGSKQWNMAIFLLIKEAAPRAGKLMTILKGPKGDDGARTGGMVENQKKLMVDDGDLVNSDAGLLVTIEWILLIGGLLIAGIVVFFTSRSIVDPIAKIIEVMAELTKGNNEVEVEGLDRKDETGEIARAVEVFKENAIEKVRLEEEEKRAVAERTRQGEAERQREAEENQQREARQKNIDGLTGGFGTTVEAVLADVVSLSGQVQTSAQSMSEIAQNTLNESVTVSSAAEQASVSVETVATAAEELSASINEISRQVSHSTEISNKAVRAAEDTNQTIQQLAEGASRIGEVVELINDIANQTNLLALNATIEAARAGEAGKGFAVVASEVKNLASQTAQATEDIGGQISSIQGVTQDAVKAIEEIGKTIGEMSEIATTIASAVEEQGAATSEISRNVQEASTGTQNVSQSIISVKSGSEETGSASGEVLNASRQLGDRFDTLRKDVEDFLKNIRAA